MDIMVFQFANFTLGVSSWSHGPWETSMSGTAQDGSGCVDRYRRSFQSSMLIERVFEGFA